MLAINKLIGNTADTLIDLVQYYLGGVSSLFSPTNLARYFSGVLGLRFVRNKSSGSSEIHNKEGLKSDYSL